VGDVVGLSGDLGTGKTELARAVIRTLAGEAITVPSPSFTLMQVYELPTLRVVHADLYRLGGPEEVAELGLEESWEEGCLLVEWPERGEGLLPEDRLRLTLELGESEEARVITIEGGARWTTLLA
jgi:tRNA threonylcarbamoyl adenosine modification protein YjeE